MGHAQAPGEAYIDNARLDRGPLERLDRTVNVPVYDERLSEELFDRSRAQVGGKLAREADDRVGASRAEKLRPARLEQPRHLLLVRPGSKQNQGVLDSTSTFEPGGGATSERILLRVDQRPRRARESANERVQPELPFLLADEETTLQQPPDRLLRLREAERLTELRSETLERGDRPYELANSGRLSIEDLTRQVREKRTVRAAQTSSALFLSSAGIAAAPRAQGERPPASRLSRRGSPPRSHRPRPER